MVVLQAQETANKHCVSPLVLCTQMTCIGKKASGAPHGEETRLSVVLIWVMDLHCVFPAPC